MNLHADRLRITPEKQHPISICRGNLVFMDLLCVATDSDVTQRESTSLDLLKKRDRISVSGCVYFQDHP
jgi:hypothetical protein